MGAVPPLGWSPELDHALTFLVETRCENLFIAARCDDVVTAERGDGKVCITHRLCHLLHHQEGYVRHRGVPLRAAGFRLRSRSGRAIICFLGPFLARGGEFSSTVSISADPFFS
jgi:hypothetical protein